MKNKIGQIVVRTELSFLNPYDGNPIFYIEGSKDTAGHYGTAFVRQAGFDDIGKGDRFRITVERLPRKEHGPRHPRNPWHSLCTDCKRYAAGHERTCCRYRGAAPKGNRYGNKYICNGCWETHRKRKHGGK